jgi:hypothetical protein
MDLIRECQEMKKLEQQHLLQKQSANQPSTPAMPHCFRCSSSGPTVHLSNIGAFKTTGNSKKLRSNHETSDLQVRKSAL